MKEPREDLTQLLVAFGDGDGTAAEELLPAIEASLRQIARRQLRGEPAGHTLQTTALINEAYLKLIDQKSTQWKNRSHFYAICARLMRRVLLDHARKKRATKRWADVQRVTLDDPAALVSRESVDLIDLNDALQKLEAIDQRQAALIELRFFGGLSIDETAEAAGVSPATAKRDLAKAKAWLYQKLTGE